MRDRLLAFLRFLLGIVTVLAANAIAVAIAGVRQFGAHRFDLIYRPLLLLLLLAGFSMLLVVSDRVGENPLAAMGLSVRGPWRRDAVIGVFLGAGMVVCAVLVLAIGGHLSMSVHFSPHTILTSGAVLLILITGAMAEELMFRGYPFQRLVDAIGAVGAVIVLSLLFGAAHLGNPHASFWGLLDTTLVGILLSLAYLRTRSLWMPWGIHFAWNTTLGLAFGLPVSGLRDFSVFVRSRADGPLWLTGGSYGIEASATGAAVVVVGTFALLKFVPKRERVVEAKPEPIQLNLEGGK